MSLVDYLDEQRVEPLAGFEAFRRVLEGVVAELVGSAGQSRQLAAE